MKLCSHCKVSKSRSKFSKGPHKDGLLRQCRKCNNIRNRKCYQMKLTHNRKIRKYYWLKNREKMLCRQRETYRKLRDLVIAGYGKKCTCCGESRNEFLTLEHIGGGGGKHRKRLHQGQIYKEIIERKFPKRYTILCSNCNFARAFHGGCPHRRK